MQSPSNSAGPRGAASHLIGIRLHGHLFPLQVWDSAFLSLSQYLLKRLPSNREFSKPFSGQPSVNQKIRLIVLMSFYFQDVVWPKEYANLGKKKSVMLRGWRGQRGGWGSLEYVLECGRMEKQDSEGLGPKKMLYLDAEGFVWPWYWCRHRQSGTRGPFNPSTWHPLSQACVFHRHQAPNHPQRGCRQRRGNSCSVAINQQFLLLKEIILDGVKRFK